MDEQELTVVTIMGYGTISTSYNIGYNIDEYDEGYDEGPEEDPASDWDKIEFYALDAETGEWEQI